MVNVTAGTRYVMDGQVVGSHLLKDSADQLLAHSPAHCATLCVELLTSAPCFLCQGNPPAENHPRKKAHQWLLIL